MFFLHKTVDSAMGSVWLWGGLGQLSGVGFGGRGPLRRWRGATFLRSGKATETHPDCGWTNSISHHLGTMVHWYLQGNRLISRVSQVVPDFVHPPYVSSPES